MARDHISLWPFPSVCCGDVLLLPQPIGCSPSTLPGLASQVRNVAGRFPGAVTTIKIILSFNTIPLPLRCFQRLSLPNVANQPCTWRDNWHTRGSSIPVLSY